MTGGRKRGGKGGRPLARFLIDGRMMTVQEIADMLGITKSTLKSHHYNKQIGYPTLVWMYRTGQMGKGHSIKHSIHGEWLTFNEAAARVGYSAQHLRRYVHDNGCTLEEAVDHFRGRAKYAGRGSEPKRYRVKGRLMTLYQAADAYGIRAKALYSYMWRHKCSLDKTVRHYEAIQVKQAEQDILRILMEGRA